MTDPTRVPALAIPVYFAAVTAVPAPPTPVPATVDGGATFDTGPIPMGGYRSLSVSAQLDQSGVLTLQTYLDGTGTIPINDAIVQNMSAGDLATVGFNGAAMLPFASARVTVQNSSGSVGNLTNFNILQGT